MVAISLISLAVLTGFLVQTTLAAPSPTVDANGTSVYVKRAASCTFPDPPETSSLSAPKHIYDVFDGHNVRYDRGKGACKGQLEGFDKDAVFILHPGATIKNVVIGPDQAEGVHCLGPCNIYNVWFEDVCEDAITIEQTSETSNIIGGGARGADDKVVQHNGGGHVNIDSFCIEYFGKLYRSCGNCPTQYKRTVSISNVVASHGKVLVGVNSNYGDTATIKSSSNSYSNLKSVCNTFEGNSNGAEPKVLTVNVKNAQYVHRSDERA
ncbi:putative effector protein [Ceratobasidium theobromae]|uniref:Pectate lyase n=1 Tax=Ceratobasidium theobromae TaxID=1582974 RepID=A0A5N5QDX1_9AGAM|nr:putative effector protein [Ceratobasidium theobromae]